MMTGGSGARIQMFKHQADVLVDMSGGTPPVSGTKYEWSTDGAVANAIGTQNNVRILGIAVRCTWTVQPTPIEAHVTIDGNAITHAIGNPTSNTWYYVSMEDWEAAETAQVLVTGGETVARQQPIYEGRAVKVEAEITGGTVSALNMRVKWARVV